MYPYTLEWFVGDRGAQVRRITLTLPGTVTMSQVRREAFSVYVERVDKDGKVMRARSGLTRGYRTVLAAYPSDGTGAPLLEGEHATLELDLEDEQARALVGTLGGNRFVDCRYRVAQVAPMGELMGLVWDEPQGVRCPQNRGWQIGESAAAELKYAWYTPEAEGPRPLILWLHGAGECCDDPRVSYMGNNVVALSSAPIQDHFGGAYVLVPTCPTMWMDDGSHTYGRTGRSMYTERLKALIDEFIASHPIDPSRVVLTGCSNGGFMCMRQLIDYPGFYAGAIPMCEALYDETIDERQLQSLAKEHIWLLHAMADPVVPPEETAAATYRRLHALGAPDVHMSYVDDRPPRHKFIGHSVWEPGFRDAFDYDFDGSPVLLEGRPVTAFQWLAAQKKD